MGKLFDFLGEVLAYVLVVVFAVLIINANFNFIPDGVFMDVLQILRNYGSLALIGIVGLEAISGRPFIIKLAFLLCAAVVIIFMFFPDTYEGLIGLI